jgi:hypothetical protein
MRAKLIGVIVVTAVSILFCLACLILVNHVVGKMEELSMEAQDFVDQGNTEQGIETMAQLAGEWEKYETFLEMMISHIEMHTVVDRYVEAGVYLTRGSLDDFYKSMALLQESLKHIENQQRVRWGNVL